MTKSINQHQIDRRAGRIFQYALPDHWICRSQEGRDDYGIDFEIQLTEQNGVNSKTFTVLPLILKIQLKGTAQAYKEKEKVKFNFKKEQLKEYNSLDIPVFLVYVFTKDNRIFWVNLQDNSDINDFITNGKDNSTSIELPNEFKLENNQINDPKDFLDKYQQICHYLWSVKPRSLKNYSDRTLEQMVYRHENELFSVIAEQLYRKNKDGRTSSDADRLYHLILSSPPDNIKNLEERFKDLFNQSEDSDFAEELYYLYTTKPEIEYLSKNELYFIEIMENAIKYSPIYRKKEKVTEILEEKLNLKGKFYCKNCGDSDEIDCDLDNGYYICIKCNDGVYVICPACGESDFIDKINFQNGTYEYECNNCDHIRTIEIESFK